MATKIVIDVDPQNQIAWSRICGKINRLTAIAPGNFGLRRIEGSKTQFLLIDKTTGELTEPSAWLKEELKYIDATVKEE